MIAPPRTAEMFLDALAEETAFREDIVGDFAEEFADRARRHGVRAARFWYYRELVRSTPHVLRTWVSGLTVSDAVRLASIAFSSLTFLLVLDVFVMAMTASILRSFGFALGHSIGELHGLARLLVFVVIGIPNATLGGVIAAYLGDGTPLLSGLAFGVVWVCTPLLVSGVVTLSGHGTVRLAAVGMQAVNSSVILGATVLGAMLRARAVRRSRAKASGD